jgi:hypothetical protein
VGCLLGVSIKKEGSPSSIAIAFAVYSGVVGILNTASIDSVVSQRGCEDRREVICVYDFCWGNVTHERFQHLIFIRLLI